MNALGQLIRAEIRSHGPMRFDRFMEQALYHPAHGYYAAPRPIGRTGDFMTSVSVGPLFGRLLARQIRQMAGLLEEPVFHVVEQGAHDGQMARDILTELAETPDVRCRLRYLIVEPSEKSRAVQERTLVGFRDRVSWIDSVGAWKEERPAGLFFSNELVDAFPVRLIECGAAGWSERCVTIGGEEALAWGAKEITDDELANAVRTLPLPDKPPYRTEVSLAAREWMRATAGFLRRGYILTIDYGYPASIYYAPSRREGTLTCYRRHGRGDDVLRAPGEQDITTHVDFTALVRVGREAGWNPLALVDQQRFLTGIAHDELAGTVSPRDGIAAHPRAWHTLTHPGYFGARFHALVQAKEAPPALDGLRFAPAGGFD